MSRPLLSSTTQVLYRTIWRWHFYAGLLCIPFILLLSITGTIYLFKPQIDQWVDSPMMRLSVEGTRGTADEQIQTAIAAVQGSRFLNYRLPENNAQAVVISVIKDRERWLVYVDPYRLKVLKTISYNSQFIRQIRTLHGELLAGTTGSILVELAGCWAIVLIITGLYLWWPRSAQGLGGVLYPRLAEKGRVFWRDLHAVCGIWISFFALFQLVTGLPWALVWGSAFAELRQLSHKHEHHAQEQADWTVSRSQEMKALLAEGGYEIRLSSQVLETAESLQFAAPVELAVSKDNPEVWTVKSDSQNRPLRADAWIDGATGQVLRTETFSDKPLIDRMVGIGVAAHEGQLFGWFNQFLGLITTSGLMLMSISGLVLWIKRKPAGVLGAPQRIPKLKTENTVAIIVVILALFLPLLAISIISVLLIEFLILKRVNPVKAWLGL